jgi:hypothetical protein
MEKALLSMVTLASTTFRCARGSPSTSALFEGNELYRSRLLSELSQSFIKVDFVPSKQALPQSVLFWGAALCALVILAVVWQLVRYFRNKRCARKVEEAKIFIQHLRDVETPVKATLSEIATSPGVMPPRGTSAPARLAGSMGSALVRRNPSQRANPVCISRAPEPRRMQQQECELSASRGSSKDECHTTTVRRPGLDLTVDRSVAVMDTNALGWAVNPHKRGISEEHESMPSHHGEQVCSYCNNKRQAINITTSIACSLQSDYVPYIAGSSASPTIAGTIPAVSSTAGSCTSSTAASPYTHSLPGKKLLRSPTESGLADFTLGTAVVEDPEESSRGSAAPRRNSSGQSRLVAARSITPSDIHAAGVDSPTSPDSPDRLPPAPPSSPSSDQETPDAHWDGVPLLTAEQLSREVHLLQVLGFGGAGSVYKATWQRPQGSISVAVKSLHPSRQLSNQAVEAFRQEISVMSRVGQHPNVVAVLAACAEAPNLAIVLELAEAGSLHRALHEKGMRPRCGTLLRLAEDMANGLAYCHGMVSWVLA